MSFLSQGEAAREIHKLSELCSETNTINPELYDIYQVKRGLREPNWRAYRPHGDLIGIRI